MSAEPRVEISEPGYHSETTGSNVVYSTTLATSQDEVREAQKLRWQVFAQEMGAELNCPEQGIDADRFDPYCQHIIVRAKDSGLVIACARVLTDERAADAGGFYSEGEFDLAPILDRGKRVLELGRTCVHPHYRQGAVISMLWSGLARFINLTRYSYIIGCASLPMGDNGTNVRSACAFLAEKYMAPEELRVTPRLPIPLGKDVKPEPLLPPLLKAYMRLGARVCSDPCWDPDFNTADLLVLLEPAGLQSRYAKRFLRF